MTDRELIESAAQALAARQGFADWKDMRQRDLEYLCECIEERSGILISLSTIRRILNGQYNRLPQVATLNAMAVYLGYTDWQSFKAAKQQQVIPPTPIPGKRARRSRPFIGIGIALFLLILTLSLKHFVPFSPKGNSLASFSFRKTTENLIPNTVVFTYDIDQLDGDSFFIQQSWDRNRRVRIYKNSHTLTDIYYEPGYHRAKLYANNRIVKTVDVSIPTGKWFFYSKESLTRGLPSYIHTDTPLRNGILTLDKQMLIANKIDPEQPQVYLYTFFPTAIAADADNFRLTARIKMTEVRNTACPFIMPEVFCQQGFMFCTFTMPGCTGSIGAQFGDKEINGTRNDLSPLAIDVHQWHFLEMLVRQKKVTISIDGKAVMKQEYTASAGLITGLGFHSNGLSQVDSIQLTGLDGKIVLQ